VGTIARSVNEVMGAVHGIRERGHHKVLLKQCFGLAGHNSLRLWEPAILDAQRRWIEQSVERGHGIVVEPWLERIQDFSVQLEMELTGLKLRGWTGLVNDLRGQFQANWAEPKHARRPPMAVTELLRDGPDFWDRFQALYQEICQMLESELQRLDYLGPVSIDAFVYRTPEGERRLKPVVEINPRYTMGRLTVELMAHISQGSCGILRVVNPPDLRRAGFADFAAFANSLKERLPVRLDETAVPKIREGHLCLNDPARAQAGLAVFKAGRTPSEVLANWP
jgi:hypothetical protein